MCASNTYTLYTVQSPYIFFVFTIYTVQINLLVNATVNGTKQLVRCVMTNVSICFTFYLYLISIAEHWAMRASTSTNSRVLAHWHIDIEQTFAICIQSQKQTTYMTSVHTRVCLFVFASERERERDTMIWRNVMCTFIVFIYLIFYTKTTCGSCTPIYSGVISKWNNECLYDNTEYHNQIYVHLLCSDASHQTKAHWPKPPPQIENEYDTYLIIEKHTAFSLWCDCDTNIYVEV